MQMKSLVVTEPYKLEFYEIPIPQIGTDTEVLVKVKAVGVCGSDIKIYHGQNTFSSYPRVLGHEAVGEVVETGKGVTTLKKGDRVVLEPIEYCGKCYACRHGQGNVCEQLKIRGINIDGGYQEYITAEEHKLHRFPDTITWKQAVMMEPYTLGAQVADRSRVQPDDVALIFGMGPAGMVVLDTFKQLGVTCIVSDMIPKRLELAGVLGADYIINAAKEDVNARVREITGGMGANVIVDAVGTPKTFEDAVELASAAGTVVPMGYTDTPAAVPTVKIGRKQLTIVGSRLQMGKFKPVIEGYAAHLDKIDRLISHAFPFEQAELAIQTAESRDENLGKVVILMEDDG